jgi:hypothetical protein
MCHSFSDINRLLASGPDAPFVLSRLGSSASLGFSPHHLQLQRSCRFSASDTRTVREILMPFIDGCTIPEVLMRPGIHGRFLAHKELGASTVSLPMTWRCGASSYAPSGRNRRNV